MRERRRRAAGRRQTRLYAPAEAIKRPLYNLCAHSSDLRPTVWLFDGELTFPASLEPRLRDVRALIATCINPEMRRARRRGWEALRSRGAAIGGRAGGACGWGCTCSAPALLDKHPKHQDVLQGTEQHQEYFQGNVQARSNEQAQCVWD